MPRLTLPLVLLLSATAVMPARAQLLEAPFTGYQLEVFRDGTFGWNAPRIRLSTFGSNDQFRMTYFRMTVGDPNYNFDAVVNVDSRGRDVTFTQADTQNGGDRHRGLIFEFDKNDGAELFFDFNVDIDRNGRGNSDPSTLVLVNNGAAPNAEIEARFESVPPDPFVPVEQVRLVGTMPDSASVNDGFISVIDSFISNSFRLPLENGQETRRVLAEERFARAVEGGVPIASPTPTAAFAGASLLGLLGLRRRR